MVEIPPDLQWIVKSMGIKQEPGETDTQFLGRLEGLQRHADLLRRAKRYGVQITPNATSKELAQAINDRLFELLEEAGVTPGKVIRLRGRQLLVEELYETGRHPREVRVKYWWVDWDRPDDRGRANHMEAWQLLQRVDTGQ